MYFPPRPLPSKTDLVLGLVNEVVIEPVEHEQELITSTSNARLASAGIVFAGTGRTNCFAST